MKQTRRGFFGWLLAPLVVPLAKHLRLFGGPYTAPATSIIIDDGKFWAGDVVRVSRTRECMLVTEVKGRELTVVRVFGLTVATAIEGHDQILAIGNFPG